ncbi:DgyrCDS4647 [Dimorphilus gyrociliatus]|uniref:DgyrCDS4647 n=1 Tax=Dimorphilus gyrociliatus TaxID=2664684 RepID=A0A7I8VHN3_9ANNE|nr:DgyrCDS4647 [Dimorphilus gyrociliatus]
MMFFSVELGFSSTPEFFIEAEKSTFKFGLLPSGIWPPQLAGNELYCKFETWLKFTGQNCSISPNEIIISENNPIHDIDLLVLEDGNCIDNRPIITIVGSCSTDKANDTIYIKQKNTLFSREIIDTTVGPSCQDPRVVQRIRGSNERDDVIEEDICYNFYGLGGEIYEILSDKLLKDEQGIIKISVDQLSIFGVKNLQWGGEWELKIRKGIHYSIKMDKNLYIKMNKGERILSIQIRIIHQNAWNDYLDIVIENTGMNRKTFDEFHQGILGSVWNKSYKFIKKTESIFEIANFPNSLDEEVKYNFQLKYTLAVDDTHTYQCQLSGESSFPGQQVIVTPGIFELFPNQVTVDISIQVLEDSNCHQGDTFTLNIACKVIAKNDPFDEVFIPFKFHADIHDTTTGKMCQDPHIIQNIAGVDENNQKVKAKLCYDIMGKAGEIMEFIGDEKLGVTVHFQLRDDFYISKVFVKSILGMLTISTGHIEGLRESKMNWGIEKEVTLNKRQFVQRISVLKNSISIESKTAEAILSIRVTRVPVDYKQGFLNIEIEDIGSNTNLLSKQHTGILGYIGNKEYIFVDPIQRDAKTCTLVVNNRLVKAYKEAKRSCYSVKLEDILYPRTTSQFKTL